jgi:hypothetical protein
MRIRRSRYNPGVKRGLFNVAVVCSLVLFLAVSWLFSRTWWYDDGFVYDYKLGREVILRTHGRRLLLCRYVVSGGFRPEQSGFHHAATLPGDYAWPTEVMPRLPTNFDTIFPDTQWAFAGVLYQSGNENPNLKVSALFIPLWYPLVLTSLLPLVWLGSFIRRKHALKVGCCLRCGYDLRATPDRCPECGTQPASPQDS